MRQKVISVIAGISLTVAFSVLLLAGFARALPASPDTSGYHVIKKIPLPGTEGWDYLTMDSDARILYISREDHIDAVNVDTGNIVGKVTGLEGTNGLLPVPELGRGFITNEDKSEVVIVDLKSLQKTGAVKTGKAPDSFAYEPVTKRVFIMNSAGASATVINAGAPWPARCRSRASRSSSSPTAKAASSSTLPTKTSSSKWTPRRSR